MNITKKFTLEMIDTFTKFLRDAMDEKVKEGIIITCFEIEEIMRDLKIKIEQN